MGRYAQINENINVGRTPSNPYGVQKGQQGWQSEMRKEQLAQLGNQLAQRASKGSDVGVLYDVGRDIARTYGTADGFYNGMAEGLKYKPEVVASWNAQKQEEFDWMADAGIDPNTGMPRMSKDSWRKQKTEADAQRAEAAANRQMNAEMRKEQMSMLGRSRASMGGTGGNFTISGL